MAIKKLFVKMASACDMLCRGRVHQGGLDGLPMLASHISLFSVVFSHQPSLLETYIQDSITYQDLSWGTLLNVSNSFFNILSVAVI